MRIFKKISLSEVNHLIDAYEMETTDCKEGCMLDNLIVENENWLLLCLETYLNEWSSAYTVKLANKNSKRDVNAIWKAWDKIACEEVDENA